MRNRFLLSACMLTVIFLTAAWMQRGTNGQSIRRGVAITFDDLPLEERQLSIERHRGGTRKLLEGATSSSIPAFADVNEVQLCVGGKLDRARAELLKLWLDARGE